MRNFADVLMEAVDAKQSRLVVGLDPRINLIPDDLREPALESSGSFCGAAAEMILHFNRIVIDLVSPYVPAVKVQVAFYELFGPPGYRAYEDTLRYAADKGLVVIGDVKRCDIGSTAQAYAHAHLGASQLGEKVVHRGHAHAITVVPYFGWEGIEPFLYAAAEATKGIFVIVRSSNPTAREIQGGEQDPNPLYLRVAERVAEWGKDSIGDCGYSAVGAVVGATYPEDLPKLREVMPHAVFLLPGYGAQGATAGDVAAAFDESGHGALVAASRRIILAHKHPGNQMWEHDIEQAVQEVNADLESSLPPLTSGRT